MKQFILFLFISIITINFAGAQTGSDIATDSFKVQGNCEMCKKRIEDAAYIKGVKRADWNEETHMLVLTYRPSKTNPQAVMQHVAHAGHDTDKFKASDAEYKKLPGCCAYKTEKCNHK